ncbi:MAG: 2TM domain-containing protein [Actinomycetota bacterium]
MTQIQAESEEELRAQALVRLQKKREFLQHLLVYALVNGMFIAIWAIRSRGFFWPMFILIGWGIGIVMHGVEAYGRGPTEDRIRREMQRMR